MNGNIYENAAAAISLLATRSPIYKYEGMMSIKGLVPSPRKSSLRNIQNGSSSSIGLLDRFPPEIMLMIMGQLDLQSLTRFARVSFLGDGFVQFCREYRDLLKFVQETIEAYRRLGLLDLHSVADINRTLWTAECDTCCSPGPFLFLPTCQRCCLGCLDYHPVLRLMSPGEAEEWYGLTKSQVDMLRVVHLRKRNVHPGIVGLISGRGRYPYLGEVWEVNYPLDHQVVIAKAARDLAIAANSGDKLMALVRARCYYNYSQRQYKGLGWNLSNEYEKFDWWFNGNPCPPHHGLLGTDDPWESSQLRDLRLNYSTKYASMAAMPFPTLTRGTRDGTTQPAEGPYWCWGCDEARARLECFRHIYNTISDWYMQVREVTACIPARYRESPLPPHRVMYILADTAHTRESFLQHIQECPNSQRVLQDVEALSD